MSENYESDDSCSECGKSVEFSIKLVKGHMLKHRVAICSHCRLEEVITDCNCMEKK